jgi:TBC1 domain family member 15
LIKAEALFRRFQRVVEAVDKKKNFPAPRSNTGEAAEPEKVITPELRKLLDRHVEVLPRTTVAEHGDGMPSR